MTEPTIPILDLSSDIAEHWAEYTGAMERVLRDGRFIMGPDVAALEGEVCEFLGAGEAIGVNSGTDAIAIALRAVGVGPGDEVITTPFTFMATASAIRFIGAEPVFADITLDTLNIDPAAVAAAITPRTKALLPVHLYGNAVPMPALQELAKKHGVPVVEDAAQAFGATLEGQQLGTLGVMGAFSFFPSKTLGAFGDAGLIVTSDKDMATEARMLRAHGSRRKYYNEIFGYNSRLDTLQAAILRCKLPRLAAANAARREKAAYYHEKLAGHPAIALLEETPGAVSAYHQYTVRLVGADRDRVAERLKARGIQTMTYYPVPLHRLPVFADLGLSFPRAEQAAREALSLPIWPGITAEQQDRVVSTLIQACEG